MLAAARAWLRKPYRESPSKTRLLALGFFLTWPAWIVVAIVVILMDERFFAEMGNVFKGAARSIITGKSA